MKLLEENHIILDVTCESKNELFEFLAQTLYDMNRITSKEAFIEALNQREKEITTGIGEGIAVPHTKDMSVLFPTLIYVRLKNELKYDSIDNSPVRHVFLIAMPTTYYKEHLEVLSKVSVILMEKENREFLLEASKDKIYELFSSQIG